MRILVDTSVWSQVLRRKQDTEIARVFEGYIHRGDQIYVMGIILQEILSGIAQRALFDSIKNILMEFPCLEIQRDVYIQAAYLRNYLRAKGITVAAIDALIAAAAMRYECHLFTIDRDFQLISKFIPLRLVSV